MAFKTSNSNTADKRALMEQGEYEVIILDARTNVTPGGTEYFGVHMVVRNDVEQKYQNKHTYDTLWLSERAVQYSERKINTINKVLELPEATYEGYDEWGQVIQGKAMRVKITHSKAQNGYEAREQVGAYMGTRFPDIKHTFPAGSSDAPAATVSKGGFTPVDDDDLPF